MDLKTTRKVLTVKNMSTPGNGSTSAAWGLLSKLGYICASGKDAGGKGLGYERVHSASRCGIFAKSRQISAKAFKFF